MTKTIDPDKLFDLLEDGVPRREIAKVFGVSNLTLSNRIGEIQKKQGLLLQYRSIQSLQLTELQAKILEAISPDKIEEASLKDLVLCYKVLKDKELVSDGKPSEIKGLVSYLVHLEREQLALDQVVEVMPNEAEFQDLELSEDPERMPNL